MWDTIILTEDRFTPFIAIYSTTLWQKNPIEWLTDIDTRIHINSICHNYNIYGLWTHFKLGVILCIFLWIITLPAVIALLWSRRNMEKERRRKKKTYTSPKVIRRCSVYCHWLVVTAIGLICLCCNHDNNNCLHTIFFSQINPPLFGVNTLPCRITYSACQVWCWCCLSDIMLSILHMVKNDSNTVIKK